MSRMLLRLATAGLAVVGLVSMGASAAWAAPGQTGSAAGYFLPLQPLAGGTDTCPAPSGPIALQFLSGTMVTYANGINIEGDAQFQEEIGRNVVSLYEGHAHVWGDNNMLNFTLTYHGVSLDGATLDISINSNQNSQPQHLRVLCTGTPVPFPSGP